MAGYELLLASLAAVAVSAAGTGYSIAAAEDQKSQVKKAEDKQKENEALQIGLAAQDAHREARRTAALREAAGAGELGGPTLQAAGIQDRRNILGELRRQAFGVRAEGSEKRQALRATADSLTAQSVGSGLQLGSSLIKTGYRYQKDFGKPKLTNTPPSTGTP